MRRARYNIMRVFLIGLFPWLLVAVSARSDTRAVARTIDQYFFNLEKEIAACASRPEMFARKTSLADRPIRKLTKNRTELSSMLRLNSRGLVLNEEAGDGRPGRKFRDLSKQKWFGSMKDRRPYYGNIVTTKGELFLFWGIPIVAKSRSGARSPAGALAVRIDVRKALNNAAKEVKKPFLVLENKARLFSHEWKSSYNEGSTYPLNLNGLENVEVVVEAETAPPPQPSAAGSAPAAQEQADNANLLIIIAALVIVGIIAAAIAGWLRIASRRRYAKLMAKIDKEQSPFEYGETVAMDRNKLMQAIERGEATAADAPSGGGSASRESLRSLEQMRAEVESDINQKLNTVLAERTKQIRREVHGEVRLGFLKKLKTYSVAIGRQIENLDRLIAADAARGPQEAQMLQSVRHELKQVQDAIEGQPADG